MSTFTIGRPETSEFADYQIGYVSKVPDTDIITFLQRQLEDVLALFRAVSEEKGNYRYAPDKWTVKELLGHVIDTERVFAYRALSFSRNDASPLPGFDQDPWLQNANYTNVPLKELLDEFDAVRRSTIYLFGHLDAGAWMRRGLANNNPITVRAQAFVIAGHVEHHLEILKSRYLS